MLGSGDALDVVAALVDQSLRDRREADGGVRYRMLETVREFGRMQLVDAGEDELAPDAAAGPGRAAFAPTSAAVSHPGRSRRWPTLAREEGNLADVLRRRLADGDPARWCC